MSKIDQIGSTPDLDSRRKLQIAYKHQLDNDLMTKNREQDEQSSLFPPIIPSNNQPPQSFKHKSPTKYVPSYGNAPPPQSYQYPTPRGVDVEGLKGVDERLISDITNLRNLLSNLRKDLSVHASITSERLNKLNSVVEGERNRFMTIQNQSKEMNFQSQANHQNLETIISNIQNEILASKNSMSEEYNRLQGEIHLVDQGKGEEITRINNHLTLLSSQLKNDNLLVQEDEKKRLEENLENGEAIASLQSSLQNLIPIPPRVEALEEKGRVQSVQISELVERMRIELSEMKNITQDSHSSSFKSIEEKVILSQRRSNQEIARIDEKISKIEDIQTSLEKKNLSSLNEMAHSLSHNLNDLADNFHEVKKVISAEIVARRRGDKKLTSQVDQKVDDLRMDLERLCQTSHRGELDNVKDHFSENDSKLNSIQERIKILESHHKEKRVEDEISDFKTLVFDQLKKIEVSTVQSIDSFKLLLEERTTQFMDEKRESRKSLDVLEKNVNNKIDRMREDLLLTLSSNMRQVSCDMSDKIERGDQEVSNSLKLDISHLESKVLERMKDEDQLVRAQANQIGEEMNGKIQEVKSYFSGHIKTEIRSLDQKVDAKLTTVHDLKSLLEVMETENHEKFLEVTESLTKIISDQETKLTKSQNEAVEDLSNDISNVISSTQGQMNELQNIIGNKIDAELDQINQKNDQYDQRIDEFTYLTRDKIERVKDDVLASEKELKEFFKSEIEKEVEIVQGAMNDAIIASEETSSSTNNQKVKEVEERIIKTLKESIDEAGKKEREEREEVFTTFKEELNDLVERNLMVQDDIHGIKEQYGEVDNMSQKNEGDIEVLEGKVTSLEYNLEKSILEIVQTQESLQEKASKIESDQTNTSNEQKEYEKNQEAFNDQTTSSLKKLEETQESLQEKASKMESDQTNTSNEQKEYEKNQEAFNDKTTSSLKKLEKMTESLSKKNLPPPEEEKGEGEMKVEGNAIDQGTYVNNS